MTVNIELNNKIRDHGLRPPETLTIAITGVCNLRCPHCLLDCRDSGASSVPADTIKRLIKEFSDLGGKSLWLSGGEPLIHPDWFDILEFAFAQTDLKEIALQTNAVIMSREDISRLHSLPGDRLSLQISLDGAIAETNDLVRGKGSYDSAVNALQMLSDNGLGRHTSIAFTEMRHNFHELPDMIRLVHNYGLKRLVSNTIVKAGRSIHYDWISLPEADQVRLLVEKYSMDPDFRNLYEQYGNISAIEWFKGRGSPAAQVCSCISMPYISASGNIYPCTMYLKDVLAVNGIHEKSLSAALLEGLPKWAELPKISRYRSENLSKCNNCPGHAHCAGGCLGRADAANGDVMTVEDRCGLRRVVYEM